jgi:hypothetical protein
MFYKLKGNIYKLLLSFVFSRKKCKLYKIIQYFFDIKVSKPLPFDINDFLAYKIIKSPFLIIG